MRGAEADRYQLKMQGPRLVKPHLMKVTEVDAMAIWFVVKSEGASRIFDLVWSNQQPLWVCISDLLEYHPAGVGFTAVEAYRDWYKRLPWWRRWLVEPVRTEES